MAANEATNKQRNLFPITKRVGNDKLQLEFYEIAQKARLIPNLPQPVDKTIEQVAEYLEELCVERTHKGEVWTGPRQATWVMDEITVVSPWEKWAGPAGLKRAHSTKFSPELDTWINRHEEDTFPGPAHHNVSGGIVSYPQLHGFSALPSQRMRNTRVRPCPP